MKQYKLLLLLLALTIYQRAQAQTATVNWTTTHQTMDGWGGQDALFPAMTTTETGLFFTTNPGIGLTYIRTANTYNSAVTDTTTVKNAVAQGAKIELGLGSPPCSLKHSYVDLSEPCVDGTGYNGAFGDGSTGNGGTCFTTAQSLATSYAEYAAYIVNYVNMLATTYGSPVAVLDVQNEPDMSSSYYAACLISPSAFDTFIAGYLGPAFASASWNSTQKTAPQIMMASQAYTYPAHDYASPCLNDGNCAKYVSIISGHSTVPAVSNMMGQPAISAFFNNGGHLWASEVDASETTYNSAMTGTDGGLVLAQAIHSYLTAQNVSGFEWWELAYYSDITPPNAGYTDSNFNPSSRYYVVGNWSKFVRPGWVRIDATVNPVSGVYVTAFKAPDNSAYAIVAVNENGSSVDLAVSLDGFPSVASVTPTVTSESFNLTDQADVSVSGTAFSYSLPATSVVTFHGAPSSSSSSSSNKSPAPPTALALIVK